MNEKSGIMDCTMDWLPPVEFHFRGHMLPIMDLFRNKDDVCDNVTGIHLAPAGDGLPGVTLFAVEGHHAAWMYDEHGYVTAPTAIFPNKETVAKVNTSARGTSMYRVCGRGGALTVEKAFVVDGEATFDGMPLHMQLNSRMARHIGNYQTNNPRFISPNFGTFLRESNWSDSKGQKNSFIAATSMKLLATAHKMLDRFGFELGGRGLQLEFTNNEEGPILVHGHTDSPFRAVIMPLKIVESDFLYGSGEKKKPAAPLVPAWADYSKFEIKEDKNEGKPAKGTR